MTIKEIAKKYELSKDDFWQLQQNKNVWIIKHTACERIASIEKITFKKPDVFIGSVGIGLVGEAKKENETMWSTGEASPKNVKGQGSYYFAMAEKRLKDRLVLKLINAFDVYSEEESDEFKKSNLQKNEKK